MRKVANDNRNILNRLQSASSHYSAVQWQKEFYKQRKNTENIKRNADRFCKHPYFVHSVTTTDMVPYQDMFVTNRSRSAMRQGQNSMRAKQRSSVSTAKGMKRRMTSASTRKSKGYYDQVGLTAEQQQLVAQSEQMMNQMQDGMNSQVDGDGEQNQDKQDLQNSDQQLQQQNDSADQQQHQNQVDGNQETGAFINLDQQQQ